MSKDAAFAELAKWIESFDLKRRDEERLAQIRNDYARGEYICSCGLRVDDKHPKGEF